MSYHSDRYTPRAIRPRFADRQVSALSAALETLSTLERQALALQGNDVAEIQERLALLVRALDGKAWDDFGKALTPRAATSAATSGGTTRE